MNLSNTQSTIKKHTHTTAEVQGLSEAITQAVANSNDVIGKGRLPTDTIYREELTQKLGEKADATHTHVMADITDLTTTLAAKADLVSGKVPLAQLPAVFTQEVVEKANKTEFPTQGAASTLYVETSTEKLYRWSGVSYIELVRSMTSTDDLPEGQVNLYFTNAKKSALEQAIEQAKTEAVQSAQEKADAVKNELNPKITEAKELAQEAKNLAQQAQGSGVNQDVTQAIETAKQEAINAIDPKITTKITPIAQQYETLNGTVQGMGQGINAMQQTVQTTQQKANDAFSKAEAIEQTLANNKFVKWQGKTAPEMKDMTKDQYTALGTYSNDVLYLIVEP